MPRWFFDRSPSEVKAAFLTRRKKTEHDQVCIPALVRVDALCQQLFIEGAATLWRVEACNISQEERHPFGTGTLLVSCLLMQAWRAASLFRVA